MTKNAEALQMHRPHRVHSHGESELANAAAARRAVDMALLMIRPLVSDPEICGAGFLHVVVMKPGSSPQSHTFEEAILLEHTLGDPAHWDADYAGFAKAKARLSWESGLDGSVVQALYPHRLKRGDTLLTGGICLDGITVGVSGAHPWYDEAFGMAIAANLRALCKAAHADLLKAQYTSACDLQSTDEQARLCA
ncbi:MAG: hypothetical protein ACM3VZ_02435 [Acidobacteriota bacterium]